MTQHTPGPWEFNELGDSQEIVTRDICENGHNHGRMIAKRKGDSTLQVRADWQLLAAAPAMYEALKAVESEITRLERISKQAFSIDEVHPAVGRVADATRAAIAAAEGGVTDESV